jgi:hypothetical protein
LHPLSVSSAESEHIADTELLQFLLIPGKLPLTKGLLAGKIACVITERFTTTKGREKMIKLKSGLLTLVLTFVLGACTATEPPNPLVGAWLLTISSPIGEMALNLNVNPDLTGAMTSEDLGSAPLTNLALNDNAVSFQTTIDAQGQVLTLVFNGVMGEDSFSGSFDTDFGAIPARAVRQ